MSRPRTLHARCGSSSSTATCSPARARTSTTRPSRRRSCAPATRSTCSARTATRWRSSGSTPRATGTRGRWRSASGARPARAVVYRPDIAGLLPLYVADRYEGIEARPFPELSDAELDRYLERNVAAVREVAERVRPDVALANHLVMGPVILARALEGLDVPYAVKVHGSALEYTVKPHPRFMPYAVEGLAGAGGVLVGSRHTAESLWAAMGDPELPARTRLGPPGVDVQRFTPREPAAAARGPGGPPRAPCNGSVPGPDACIVVRAPARPRRPRRSRRSARTTGWSSSSAS